MKVEVVALSPLTRVIVAATLTGCLCRCCLEDREISTAITCKNTGYVLTKPEHRRLSCAFPLSGCVPGIKGSDEVEERKQPRHHLSPASLLIAISSHSIALIAITIASSLTVPTDLPINTFATMWVPAGRNVSTLFLALRAAQDGAVQVSLYQSLSLRLTKGTEPPWDQCSCYRR